MVNPVNEIEELAGERKSDEKGAGGGTE